ncbi:MAG TPA: hypothetical protein VL854_08300 [Nitrososphaeraceae archaeon]|nr:hypothetical protein [Nitrososphaeraceae archaeon]
MSSTYLTERPVNDLKSVDFLDSYRRLANGRHLYMMHRNKGDWTNYTKGIFLPVYLL